jgi:hypothetical protein
MCSALSDLGMLEGMKARQLGEQHMSLLKQSRLLYQDASACLLTGHAGLKSG